MGLRIATNIQSLSAQRSLQKVKATQNSALEKLSSGNRINKAGDDAAGLAISEKLKAGIRGAQQANRNAGDGVSLIQTAEGGLNEVSNILVRLRELSVQAASDTVGDKERAYSDMEFQQLVTEIDRIAASTTFNEKSLLSGEGESMDFQIGFYNNPQNDRITYNPATQNVQTEAIGLAGVDVKSKLNAQENLQKIDDAMNAVNGNRAELGALQNRLQSTIRNLEVQTENMAATNSRIRDTDIATESAELAKANILSASGVSVLAQANTSGTQALSLIG